VKSVHGEFSSGVSTCRNKGTLSDLGVIQNGRSDPWFIICGVQWTVAHWSWLAY